MCGLTSQRTSGTPYAVRAPLAPNRRPPPLRLALHATGRRRIHARTAAAGLGLVEALYCDIRLSTPDAKFTTAFARRGLIAEYGIAWLLPRLIGQSRAMDLLLSGRVVRGTEAHEMGLVNKVVEPDQLLDAAVEYATELATWSSPTSMSIMKRQVLQALDTDFVTAADAADALMPEAFRRPDATEGVTSYLEGRAPAFRPLDPK
ncbi:enoyl-CoA hydratase-related protein [Streptomyces sp. NPDC001939]